MQSSVVRPAGFWIRLLALILDGILLWVLFLFLSFLGNDDPSIIVNIVDCLYGLLLPIFWSGYTVGKRICGIRITRLDDRPVGLGTMLLRNFVAGLIYILTLGIALIVSIFMVAFRSDKRAIHDFVAGTYVTHEAP
ncbi:MAG TPA: RDD family protein [Bacillales bacterium]|nr:RDD family protein [Bacillales bacterium]